MTVSKLDMLKAFYDRVWLMGDLEAVDQFFGAGEPIQGMIANENVGSLDMKTLIEAFMGLLEDPEYEIRHTVEQGDWFSALVQIDATASMTGKRIAITGQVMMRVTDGQIAEAYNHFDYMGFFEQMGFLPADSLPQLLSGALVA